MKDIWKRRERMEKNGVGNRKKNVFFLIVISLDKTIAGIIIIKTIKNVKRTVLNLIICLF
jgi:hypothetical protein